MKRVVVILILALVVAFSVGVASEPFFGNRGCKGCQDDSARAELQEALSGADAFYYGNRSYSGIYDGSGVSTIGDIVLGLSFVSGQPSTGRTVISLATSPRAGWLVMAAYANEARNCFIVIELKRKQTRPVAGESDRSPGVFYGVIRDANATACTASVNMAGTGYSSSGWHGS